MNLNEFQQTSSHNGDHMLLSEYQTGAVSTAIYPGTLAYPTLGLCGEVGELIAATIANRDFDDCGDVKKEIGDVLWYVANVASDIPATLREVMTRNHFIVCPEMWDVEEVRDELPVLAGVVAENVKKAIRDHEGHLTDARAENIMKALRLLVIWLERLCSYYGFTLEECAQLNLDKLQSRKDRGVLKGDGDDR